jgi:hyperosmotically inducible protein
MELNMHHLIRFGTAALAACCAFALASPAAHAQPPSPNVSTNAPTTRARTPQDAAIADRVSAALNAEPNHLYRHVTVSVTNGVVRLGGLAYSNDAIQRAKEVARNTPGVSSVEDQIQLERQGSNPP